MNLVPIALVALTASLSLLVGCSDPAELVVKTFETEEMWGASFGRRASSRTASLKVSGPTTTKTARRCWRRPTRIARGKAFPPTGTTTGLLGVNLPTPPIVDSVTVRFTMQLPDLTAGSYSMTLMASTLDPEGQPALCERVANAKAFRIATNSKIPGIVGIACEAEIIA